MDYDFGLLSTNNETCHLNYLLREVICICVILYVNYRQMLERIISYCRATFLLYVVHTAAIIKLQIYIAPKVACKCS